MPESQKGDRDHQPGLEDLIPLSQAAKLSGLSPSQLRLLVSSGTIWGVKPGRNWFTTEQAVKEYLTRDRRPGPKPKHRSRPDSEKG
ncbi:MAG: helix-turn-helix domain-containing protein [Chloroflexi bacterium]|nr:helix-turn-helix domain-containing protein [Chloroflexota bacterium]